MSCFKILPKLTRTAVIVTFSGRQLGMATLTFFEFKNFLQENYPNYDQHFFVDKRTLWYTRGIEDVSTNINETLEYLKSIIEGYDSVIFIGASMGGYAALLYGSLLNVDYVITFRPQSIIKIEDNPEYDPTYLDLKPIINDTTKYYLYGDSAITDDEDLHNINHCIRLLDKQNIILYEHPNFNIKEYRDEGKLKEDFSNILSGL